MLINIFVRMRDVGPTNCDKLFVYPEFGRFPLYIVMYIQCYIRNIKHLINLYKK